MHTDNDCGQRDLYEHYRDVEHLKAFAQSLAKIRVLWRAPDTLDLWGIPYDLRPGQTPYDLFRSKICNRSDWVWLGQPGWWGHYDKPTQDLIRVFLAKHAEFVPGNCPDFSVLPIGG